jgi:hypothetical protein
MQYLECHIAVMPGIPREVYRRHATSANLPGYAISAKRGARLNLRRDEGGSGHRGQVRKEVLFCLADPLHESLDLLSKLDIIPAPGSQERLPRSIR